jgi:hypothetical protein
VEGAVSGEESAKASCVEEIVGLLAKGDVLLE